MRKLCPNLDREDGLDTVLEVPIPEEMFVSNSRGGGSNNTSGCTSMMSWVRPQHHRCHSADDFDGAARLQLMLGVVGAPLLPFSVRSREPVGGRSIKDDPIEASMAKYIVQQYVAAAGGEKALNSISSMYAMGKVQMRNAEEPNASSNRKKKAAKGGGEMGGFVLWQKKPDLWCLELVVSGRKLAAGSDGKVAWRQTPGQQPHASRGPPRPLRRTLQGLDPRSIANLFSGAVCDGEKAVNGDDCFVLRLDTETASLQARSTRSVETMRHTVWGCFSQRTGLLVQLEDSHLVRMIRGAADKESVYWETTTETSIEDYRLTDGINISHKGTTSVSLLRFGETIEGNMRTSMAETWTVEEVGFDVRGLSMECFLPPGDLKEEKEGCEAAANNGHPPIRVQVGIARHGSSKVVAVNIEDSDSTEDLI
ncbi:uncharacterized protein M6B38_136135 [Iris pallida]|uniref:Uncharacterized protein n=1 Tax=Iris pallida TaxID=29817 RepID=A0AAX6FG75_IRIPA|nr:uncharacterized protein M6B38_136135 [Iris pallida]